MSEERRGRRSSRVPSGRLERLARIGWMAGEFALGGLTEGAKRAVGSGSANDSAPIALCGNVVGLAASLPGGAGGSSARDAPVHSVAPANIVAAHNMGVAESILSMQNRYRQDSRGKVAAVR